MEKSSDKKDRLERFVRDNREEFDALDPSETLWSKIIPQLPEASTPPATPSTKASGWYKPYFEWRLAAAVLLAVGISYLFYLNREYGLARDPKVAIMNPAYAREFSQFNLVIDQKRTELLRLTNDNPELYREFAADLDRLETNYRNLRAELSQAPNREALLKAMVKNLQWQLDLLNQQLSILERIQSAKEGHEKQISI